MAVYDKDGYTLSAAYDKDGYTLSAVYDKDGNNIWTADRNLTVACYNVGQWYIGNGSRIPAEVKAEYTELQTTIFDNIHADICMMQEATTTFCQDGTLAETFLEPWFNDVHITRGNAGFQAHMIASKNIRIEDYTEVPFISAGGNYPGYETAYISYNGKRIFLLNTHVTTSQATQELQCEEVLQAVADKEYFVICGDFNTVIHDKTEVDYINCIKPFADEGYNLANCGNFGIFNTYRRTAEAEPQDGYKPATDHIITSANIDIEQVFVDTTKLTDGIGDKIDHIPIVAVLSIN